MQGEMQAQPEKGRHNIFSMQETYDMVGQKFGMLCLRYISLCLLSFHV